MATQLNDVESLRPIHEVPAPYHEIFSAYPCFNILQSKVLDDVLHSDASMVISAPTGSGKTVIFELAVIRALISYSNIINSNQFKIVYVSPMKALCEERLIDWHRKFSAYGLNCISVTGDSDNADFKSLVNHNLVITTPEKWDSLTRRWKDNVQLVHMVKLFLIDEVHLLNEESRGPTLEAIVSRMKTIEDTIPSSGNQGGGSSDSKIRYMALSATIPNIEDIANWIGQPRQAKYFKFSEDIRPIKLKKIVMGFPRNLKTSIFQFDLFLNYKLQSIILQHSEGKPTLIFCSTRKSTELTARHLMANLTVGLTPEQRARLQDVASRVSDRQLSSLLLHGLACHHGGMLPETRRAVEGLFRAGDLPVLVATSTLAAGVNLPARLVIVKGTKCWTDGQTRDYAESMFMQMSGRAGRPGLETEGTVIVMTSWEDKGKFEKMIGGNEPIESSLHRHLTEHLNAEVVLRTITGLDVAMRWLSSTFLYVRARKHPRHYGFPTVLDPQQIDKKLLEMCQIEINKLVKAKLITLDENIVIKPTILGSLMAKYYISFGTMKLFTQITGNEILQQLLMLLAKCEEFSELYLRVGDKRCLNLLNKASNRETIRFTLKGKIKTLDMKINCIMQAAFGCLEIQDHSIVCDTYKIMRSGERISKCFIEYLETREKCFSALLNAIILAKCFHVQLWENSEYVSKQLSGIGNVLARHMVRAGKTSFRKILASSPREIELIIKKKPPVGDQLLEEVRHLPSYEMNVQLVGVGCEIEVHLNLSLKNAAVLQVQSTANTESMMCLLVGDDMNEVLLFEKYTHSYMIENPEVKRIIPVKSLQAEEVTAHFISEDWVGFDCVSSVTVRSKTDRSVRAKETGLRETVDSTKEKPLVQKFLDMYYASKKIHRPVNKKSKTSSKKSSQRSQVIEEVLTQNEIVKNDLIDQPQREKKEIVIHTNLNVPEKREFEADSSGLFQENVSPNDPVLNDHSPDKRPVAEEQQFENEDDVSYIITTQERNSLNLNSFRGTERNNTDTGKYGNRNMRNEEKSKKVATSRSIYNLEGLKSESFENIDLDHILNEESAEETNTIEDGSRNCGINEEQDVAANERSGYGEIKNTESISEGEKNESASKDVKLNVEDLCGDPVFSKAISRLINKWSKIDPSKLGNQLKGDSSRKPAHPAMQFENNLYKPPTSNNKFNPGSFSKTPKKKLTHSPHPIVENHYRESQMGPGETYYCQEIVHPSKKQKYDSASESDEIMKSIDHLMEPTSSVDDHCLNSANKKIRWRSPLVYSPSVKHSPKIVTGTGNSRYNEADHLTVNSNKSPDPLLEPTGSSRQTTASWPSLLPLSDQNYKERRDNFNDDHPGSGTRKRSQNESGCSSNGSSGRENPCNRPSSKREATPTGSKSLRDTCTYYSQLIRQPNTAGYMSQSVRSPQNVTSSNFIAHGSQTVSPSFNKRGTPINDGRRQCGGNASSASQSSRSGYEPLMKNEGARGGDSVQNYRSGPNYENNSRETPRCKNPYEYLKESHHPRLTSTGTVCHHESNRDLYAGPILAGSQVLQSMENSPCVNNRQSIDFTQCLNQDKENMVTAASHSQSSSIISPSVQFCSPRNNYIRESSQELPKFRTSNLREDPPCPRYSDSRGDLQFSQFSSPRRDFQFCTPRSRRGGPQNNEENFQLLNPRESVTGTATDVFSSVSTKNSSPRGSSDIIPEIISRGSSEPFRCFPGGSTTLGCHFNTPGAMNHHNMTRNYVPNDLMEYHRMSNNAHNNWNFPEVCHCRARRMGGSRVDRTGGIYGNNTESPHFGYQRQVRNKTMPNGVAFFNSNDDFVDFNSTRPNNELFCSGSNPPNNWNCRNDPTMTYENNNNNEVDFPVNVSPSFHDSFSIGHNNRGRDVPYNDGANINRVYGNRADYGRNLNNVQNSSHEFYDDRARYDSIENMNSDDDPMLKRYYSYYIGDKQFVMDKFFNSLP